MKTNDIKKEIIKKGEKEKGVHLCWEGSRKWGNLLVPMASQQGGGSCLKSETTWSRICPSSSNQGIGKTEKS